MARGKHSADGGYEFERRKDDYKEKKNYENDEVVNSYSYNDYEEEDYIDDDARDLRIKIICSVVAILLILGIAIFITFKKPNKPVEEPVVTENVVENNNLADLYEGYEVLGKIKIDDINVEQFILNSKEEDALQKGVVKLYGGSLNNYGNLCLAAHNVDEMFGKLNELDVGAVITIIEKDNSETKYKVKEILSVEPTDLTPLIPNEEKVELTLITCENASTKRLIIKAEEQE